MKKGEDLIVEKIVENEDGSADVTLEISDNFIELFLRERGADSFDKEEFSAWFNNALKEGLDSLENQNE
jgi:hypothetical protein